MAALAAFDLTYLFVEMTFGGILISAIGLAALFFWIGMIGKESFMTNIMVVSFFLMTFAIGYVGGFATFILGLIGIVYVFKAVTSFITSGN